MKKEFPCPEADQNFIENFLSRNTIPLTLSAKYNRFNRTVTELGRLPSYLSISEAKLLEIFVYNPNNTFSTQDLYKIIYPIDKYIINEIIWVNKSRLETKLRPFLDETKEKLIIFDNKIGVYKLNDLLLRTQATNPSPKKITSDGLLYDFFHRAIRFENELFPIGGKSNQFLEVLISLPNEAVNDEKLIKLIFGQQYTVARESDIYLLWALKSRSLSPVLERFQYGLSKNIITGKRSYMWHQDD